MSTQITTTPTHTPTVASQSKVIDMWLHGKSKHTYKNYLKAVERLFMIINKPLLALTLEDIQLFQTRLSESDLSVSTQATIINSVKSLLSFGQRIGYLRFNVGASIKPEKAQNTLSERILSEGDVLKMIHTEDKIRNEVILRLLYSGALRVSELVGLKRKDIIEQDSGRGQITVLGKGNKTRTIVLHDDTWSKLKEYLLGTTIETELDSRIDKSDIPNQPIFLSVATGRAITDRAVRKIVLRAAKRVGINKAVSPHWLRHCHISHSLDKGTPIHLVRDTAGHSDLSTTSKYAHARPDDSSSRYLSV